MARYTGVSPTKKQNIRKQSRLPARANQRTYRRFALNEILPGGGTYPGGAFKNEKRGHSCRHGDGSALWRYEIVFCALRLGKSQCVPQNCQLVPTMLQILVGIPRMGKRKRGSGAIGRRRKHARKHNQRHKAVRNPKPTDRERKMVPHVVTSSLPNKLTDKERRISIYCFWIKTLGAPGPKSWTGHDGAISAVIRGLKMTQGSYGTVKKVLEDGWKLHLKGEVYEGTHRLTGRESNNKALVRPGTVDEQLIADLIEDGASLREVAEKVNISRKSRDRSAITVTINSVRTVIKRLNPIITKIEARCQGSTDPNAPWSRARYAQFQQYRLRLGRQRFSKLTIRDMMKPCFHNLSEHRFKIEQSTFFDETHPKCVDGTMARGNSQTRFPRGINGNIDPDGVYNERRTYSNQKYGSDIRLMLGCGMKKDQDGNMKGEFSRECNLLTLTHGLIYALNLRLPASNV